MAAAGILYFEVVNLTIPACSSESWEVNRHITWCANSYHVVSQCSLMPGCRVGLRRSAPTYGKR